MKRIYRKFIAVAIVILSTTLSLNYILFDHHLATSTAFSRSSPDDNNKKSYKYDGKNTYDDYNINGQYGNNINILESINEDNRVHGYNNLDGNIKHPTCSPHLHIFYLKVPKTGSSTMSNILSRLTYKHNLIPLSKKRPHPLDIYRDDSGNFSVTNQGINKFDIHWTHTKYDYSKIVRFMQKDTRLVMTLRHPFNQMRSKLYYKSKITRIFSQDKNSTKNVSFSAFLDLPAHTNSKGMYKFDDPKASKFQNDMFLYFKPKSLKSGYVLDYLQQVKRNFSNVIITEYYDESLVLLKRSLCLDMEDILYLDLKKANYLEKSKSVEEYGNELGKKLERLSFLDYKLYDMFLKLHHQKIRHEGISFQRELNIYRNIKEQTTEFCLDLLEKLKGISSLPMKKKLIENELCINKTEFNKKFSVTGTDCVLMTYRVGCYHKAFLARDYPEGCANSNYPVNLFDNEYCPSNSDKFLLSNFPVDTIHGFCDDMAA